MFPNDIFLIKDSTLSLVKRYSVNFEDIFISIDKLEAYFYL